MDYQTIDRLMAARSLASDPAFGEDLYISIEPMPNLNGCPLGLYYPERPLIALPPDATEGALLHELGHRHGHYYYDDLSERYAENFRERYQKGRALLYMGNHLENLPKCGVLFSEGERGAVEITLNYPPTTEELHNFKSLVLSHQIHSEKAPRFYYGGNDTPWVRVDFTKGVDWLVIIGSVMAASVLATAGALGYAVYKVSETQPWIIPVSLLGTGMFFLLRAMAREAKARVPAR